MDNITRCVFTCTANDVLGAVYNVVGKCSPPDICVPGTPVVCGDGVLSNGPENCGPATGTCDSSGSPCDSGLECCEEHEGYLPQCAVPTASQ